MLYRFTEWFLVIPFLPLAIVLATILGRSLVTIIVVIGVTAWPGTALLIRAQTLSIKERPYLERARVLGAGRWHQMTRHVLPNVMPMVFANTTLTVAIAILTETTLSFLGPRRPDAGVVGVDARGRLRRGRHDDRRVVVHHPAGRVRRARRAVVHPGRPGARGDLQPAAAEALMTAASLLGAARDRGLTVSYRTSEGPLPAVRGVDLAVGAGEVVGIAGESGCGKSTLVSTVLRLQPKDAEVSGEVLRRRRATC